MKTKSTFPYDLANLPADRWAEMRRALAAMDGRGMTRYPTGRQHSKGAGTK